eukprot:TRINITY_DN77876_c0_g1_i1.p1 TRINITY_DN77876_c0_g1~~TRINITY_DN77876_c0_g1_i1.p1  ORF type:complete len:202 (+),score=49.52 TRINITY_DN77876_c0_g1_i1:77-607(+)
MLTNLWLTGALGLLVPSSAIWYGDSSSLFVPANRGLFEDGEFSEESELFARGRSAASFLDQPVASWESEEGARTASSGFRIVSTSVSTSMDDDRPRQDAIEAFSMHSLMKGIRGFLEQKATKDGVRNVKEDEEGDAHGANALTAKGAAVQAAGDAFAARSTAEEQAAAFPDGFLQA